ncbi:MAG: mycothiol system anti-sigma-R factor [Actinobacteria bacterium]|nr:mycothiol system anti-sigma-R factor [Actinomycetota bacterium]
MTDNTSKNMRGPEIVGCREAMAKLYSFLDGDLTEQRREAVQRHLDECSPCVQAYDFEAELKKVLAARCKDSVPGYLKERIYNALRSEEQKSQPL